MGLRVVWLELGKALLLELELRKAWSVERVIRRNYRHVILGVFVINANHTNTFAHLPEKAILAQIQLQSYHS